MAEPLGVKFELEESLLGGELKEPVQDPESTHESHETATRTRHWLLRALPFAVVGAMATTALTGCGGEDDDDDEEDDD